MRPASHLFQKLTAPAAPIIPIARSAKFAKFRELIRINVRWDHNIYVVDIAAEEIEVCYHRWSNRALRE
jgi:hypothetical protein